ncbi:MAG: hypothetical protein JNK05_11800 [Myxococcales bacterium]|nr:hypothetical protein [Myxococcales bacterium]
MLALVGASAQCSGASRSETPMPQAPRPRSPTLPCSANDEASPGTRTEAILVITNPCATPLTLRWIDFANARVTYRTIDPVDQVEQQTWMDHRWVLTDAAGQCVSRVVITSPRVEWNVERSQCPAERLPPPPASLRLDPFYRQHLDVMGIPVVGSQHVSPRALREAARLVRLMLARHPEYAQRLVAARVRVAIMARNEHTTDIPEHSDLNRVYPPTDWNARARGLAATAARPASSGAEENLLCEGDVRYPGESIFIHEFAHTIHLLAIAPYDPRFVAALQRAYRAARRANLWTNTYATAATDANPAAAEARNIEEYWAEGVQSFYNANREATPPDGVHNHVNTRDELRVYDRALYDLIAEVFPDNWTYQCPTR